MNIFKILISADIAAFALSVVFCDSFVIYSYEILSKIYDPIRMDLAYGCVLFIFYFLSSTTRSLIKGDEANRRITVRGLIIRVIPILAAMVAANSISSYPATMVASDVTGPYISYVFSVIFCLGFGYSISDTVFYFFGGNKK